MSWSSGFALGVGSLGAVRNMTDADLDTDADGINTVFMPDERQSPRSLLSALNEASMAARNGWLGFLALMAYLLVALAGVSHTDLLLDSPVTLPLLGIDVALSRFFLFAPLFLLFVHAGLVIQHVMLSRKITALEDHMKADEENDVHPLRYELHSYFFTQSLAGPPRSFVFSLVLDGMLWLSLTALPVFLLLYFQVSFLPFHDISMTWVHRIYLMLDLIMLLAIGLFIHAPEASFFRAIGRAFWRRPVRSLLGIVGAIMAVTLSLLVLTIPDEPIEKAFLRVMPSHLTVDLGENAEAEGRRLAFALTAAVLERPVNPVNGKPSGLFHRNLIVTDADLVPNSEDGYKEVSRNLRDRDLRYARLDRSDLHRADFTGSNLSGASFTSAHLANTRFSCPATTSESIDVFEADSGDGGCTRLAGANLKRADLSGADLSFTVLNRARMQEAILRQAKFYRAKMQGTQLGLANLSGADLSLADLHGADLSWANLSGVNAGAAQLHAANLKGADLSAANFTRAKLHAADLSGAKLIGSRFQNARLFGANLSGATLTGADFRRVSIWSTQPPVPEDAALADFTGLKVALPRAAERSHMKGILASIKNENLKRRMTAILVKNGGDAGWGTSSSHLVWGQLQRATPYFSGTGSAARALAGKLASLACNDHTKQGVIANGILDRVVGDFNGSAVAIFDPLSAAQCRGADRLNKLQMYQLAAQTKDARDIAKARKIKRRQRKRPAPVPLVSSPSPASVDSAPKSNAATVGDGTQSGDGTITTEAGAGTTSSQ